MIIISRWWAHYTRTCVYVFPRNNSWNFQRGLARDHRKYATPETSHVNARMRCSCACACTYICTHILYTCMNSTHSQSRERHRSLFKPRVLLRATVAAFSFLFWIVAPVSCGEEGIARRVCTRISELCLFARVDAYCKSLSNFRLYYLRVEKRRSSVRLIQSRQSRISLNDRARTGWL